jgi:hypothetical protein
LGFLVLYAVGLYVLLRTLRAPPLAGLAAVAFIAVLPSNMMVLGPAYAVPSSASLGPLALALAAHQRLTEGPAVQGRWILLAAASAAFLAIIYPLSLIVLAALVAIDWLARPALRASRYGRILAAAAAALGVAFCAFEWRGGIEATARHLRDLLIVTRDWHLADEFALPLGSLAPYPLLALAAVGACSSARRADARWLAALPALPLAAWCAFEQLGASLVLPYQRVSVYLGLGACVCAALGIASIARGLAKRGARAWLEPTAAGVLVLLVFVYPRGYASLAHLERELRPRASLREAAAWIEEHYRPPARIYTTPWRSAFVEPLTGLRVAPVGLDALLTGTQPPPIDCQEGWEIVIGPVACPGYREVFRSGGLPVFERTTDTPAEGQPRDSL